MDKEKNTRLIYTIKEEPRNQKKNRENLKEVEDKLQSVGIYLYFSDNELIISVNNDQYNEIRKRKAGRKYVRAVKKQDAENLHYEFYYYSDIILMLYNEKLSDKYIYTEVLKMAQPTYSRHKRKMLNSEYYKNIDKNRVNDADYLNSIP